MKLVDTSITLSELQTMAETRFGDMVKAVVDVRRGVMAVDADLHSDEEAVLLESGSFQSDLWGINLYPDLPHSDWVEFDSMINIRPSQGNRSRSVDDVETRGQIIAVVDRLAAR